MFAGMVSAGCHSGITSAKWTGRSWLKWPVKGATSPPHIHLQQIPPAGGGRLGGGEGGGGDGGGACGPGDGGGGVGGGGVGGGGVGGGDRTHTSQ